MIKQIFTILLLSTITFASTIVQKPMTNAEISIKKQQRQAGVIILNILDKMVSNYYPKEFDEKELLTIIRKISEKMGKEKTYDKQIIYKEFKKLFVDDISNFYTKKEFVAKYKHVITQSKIKTKKYDDITYIKIQHLSKDNIDKVKQILSTKPDKLILDFRDNAISDEAPMIDLANMLIDDGVIFSRKFKQKKKIKSKIFEADSKTTLLSKNAQIVILVNHLTGTTAEAMAHSLSLKKNIKTIGKETSGKDFYLDLYGLSNGDILVLKSGEYCYGKYKIIDRIGKRPETEIDEDKILQGAKIWLKY